MRRLETSHFEINPKVLRVFAILFKIGENMKNSKRIKGFAVGCLAVLMCGTALLGVGCTPATSGVQGASPSNPAGINTSPFGLCPETDPVVYTTESGLEIKCSNALTNTNLASYTYLTMGSYDGTPVNWVIIGYDPSVSGHVGEFSGEADDVDPIQGGHSFGSTVDDSPMGNAIKQEMFAISSEAKPNDEIGDGCVLCLSENVIETTVWASTNYSKVMYFNNEDNYVRSKCETYYNNDTFNFGTNLFNIEIQTLTQLGDYRVSSSGEQIETISTDLYFFPLATAKANPPAGYRDAIEVENFQYFNYLTDQEYTCGYDVWGRSNQHCDGANYFSASGSREFSKSCNSYSYIRPAFVMKLV